MTGQLRFLIDEDFDNDILRGVLRRMPDLNVVRAQDVGLSGQIDSVVLDWAAREGRILLTHDGPHREGVRRRWNHWEDSVAKKKRKMKHDPEWPEAKKRCRLNMEDVRMAKELGLHPRSLIKNIPNKSQPWKLPVREWIREMYGRMQQRAAKRRARRDPQKATKDDIPSVGSDAMIESDLEAVSSALNDNEIPF